MKRDIILFLMIGLICMIAGCYEDKGSYDYKEVNAVSYTHLDVYKRQGLYWNVFQFSSEMSDHQQTKIAPGISVAQLCLPDGNVINLDKDKIYNLQLSEGGRFVNEQGVLTYEGGTSKMNVIQYNEIWIPRGGEYKLVLPDGTIVWLNAESSLRFPTSFTRCV